MSATRPLCAQKRTSNVGGLRSVFDLGRVKNSDAGLARRTFVSIRFNKKRMALSVTVGGRKERNNSAHSLLVRVFTRPGLNSDIRGASDPARLRPGGAFCWRSVCLTMVPPTECARDIGCRPRRSLGFDRLLVVADAAAQITRLGDETHLRNRRLVCAGPWKHVADLSDLTIRFLRRGVEFRAIYLAGGVLKGPDIRAQKLLCIVAGNGKDFAVAEFKAKGRCRGLRIHLLPC
jgi:hypothetical protein